MKRRRPGLVTTFAITNMLFAVLLLSCGIKNAIAACKMEFTGVDVRPLKQKIMQENVPGYAAYPIGNLAISIVLAVGFAVSGVGLMLMQGWGRFLAMGCAALCLVYQLMDTLYILVWVNPANAKFWDNAPLKAGGLASVIDTVTTLMWTLLVVLYTGLL